MGDNGDRKKDQTKSRWLVLLLLLITAAAICVAVWAVFFREADTPIAPDYAPQETEQNAQDIPNDSGEKMESEEGGGSVSLTYSNQVTIDLSDKAASLLFANPGKSNQDMVVQIVIRDEVIVQSGALSPGHQVVRLDLLPGAAEKLSPGGYNGEFVVLYYDQETGERAIVNTEIPIQITVIE